MELLLQRRNNVSLRAVSRQINLVLLLKRPRRSSTNVCGVFIRISIFLWGFIQFRGGLLLSSDRCNRYHICISCVDQNTPLTLYYTILQHICNRWEHCYFTTMWMSSSSADARSFYVNVAEIHYSFGLTVNRNFNKTFNLIFWLVYKVYSDYHSQNHLFII
jgi:hypothetical protein